MLSVILSYWCWWHACGNQHGLFSLVPTQVLCSIMPIRDSAALFSFPSLTQCRAMTLYWITVLSFTRLFDAKWLAGCWLAGCWLAAGWLWPLMLHNIKRYTCVWWKLSRQETEQEVVFYSSRADNSCRRTLQDKVLVSSGSARRTESHAERKHGRRVLDTSHFSRHVLKLFLHRVPSPISHRYCMTLKKINPHRHLCAVMCGRRVLGMGLGCEWVELVCAGVGLGWS